MPSDKLAFRPFTDVDTPAYCLYYQTGAQGDSIGILRDIEVTLCDFDCKRHRQPVLKAICVILHHLLITCKLAFSPHITCLLKELLPHYATPISLGKVRIAKRLKSD
jgi:hypothetical protein